MSDTESDTESEIEIQDDPSTRERRNILKRLYQSYPQLMNEYVETSADMPDLDSMPIEEVEKRILHAQQSASLNIDETLAKLMLGVPAQIIDSMFLGSNGELIDEINEDQMLIDSTKMYISTNLLHRLNSVSKISVLFAGHVFNVFSRPKHATKNQKQERKLDNREESVGQDIPVNENTEQ